MIEVTSEATEFPDALREFLSAALSENKFPLPLVGITFSRATGDFSVVRWEADEADRLQPHELTPTRRLTAPLLMFLTAADGRAAHMVFNGATAQP